MGEAKRVSNGERQKRGSMQSKTNAKSGLSPKKAPTFVPATFIFPTVEIAGIAPRKPTPLLAAASSRLLRRCRRGRRGWRRTGIPGFRPLRRLLFRGLRLDWWLRLLPLDRGIV